MEQLSLFAASALPIVVIPGSGTEITVPGSRRFIALPKEEDETMMIDLPVKNPVEILDYTFDWLERLESEAIASSEWVTIPATGVDVSKKYHSRSRTMLRVGGGTHNQTYVLKNTVVTLNGQTFVQMFNLPVKEENLAT